MSRSSRRPAQGVAATRLSFVLLALCLLALLSPAGAAARLLAGSGLMASAKSVKPTVTISSPTHKSSYLTNKTKVALSGRVASHVRIVSVSWTNSRGGKGKAKGTRTWRTAKIPLKPGLNIITVTAKDARGHKGIRRLRVTCDRTAPVVTISSPANGATLTTASPLLAYSVDDPTATVAVELDGVAVTSRSGDHLAALAQGAYTLTVTATDPAGNVGQATTGFAVQIVAPPSVTPPPLDETVPTTTYDATAFLYSGSDPIQTGVKAGTIDPQLAAVVRGQVTDRAGQPLPGVTVTVLDHPEYGQTQSRADGWFDLAVNGGTTLAVSYSLDGYPSATRQSYVDVANYTVLDTVVLVPYDSKVATVSLAAKTMQVAQGSTVSDADGSRQSTLLIPAGTTAQMVMPNGATQPLSSLAVRQTEFTVGANGPEAMPAALPPSSAYTYCVDLSADQATAAGASSVTFSQPLIHYVQNFLGFPAGTIVPLGYFDPARNAWVAAKSGLVVKILSTSGGKASLDVDGSGQAASAAQLAALGITDAELSTLASTYKAGESLWRVQVSHFSTYDCNLGWGAPDDARDPDVPDLTSPDDPCTESGSVIGPLNQTLGERQKVFGTPYTLAYQSERTAGYLASDELQFDAAGGSGLPASCVGVEVDLSVAGQEIDKAYAPAASVPVDITWDGKDAYGRTVQGTTSATVRIGYTYQGVYTDPATFGQFASNDASVDRARTTVTFWQTQSVTLGSYSEAGPGLGGWSIDAQQVYDRATDTLYSGSGTTTQEPSAASFSWPAVIKTVAGDPYFSGNGDGGPASNATASAYGGILEAPDGTIFFSDYFSDRVRAISPRGVITTVAGGGSPADGLGDGGPATDAYLATPCGLARGADGSLYIVDQDAHRVRKVAPDGTISTVAGNGNDTGPLGDGGPATEAVLANPVACALGPDGSLYIADQGGDQSAGSDSGRIRKVAPDGTITTVAGGGTPADGLGDGLQATDAALAEPTDVAVAPDGSLYIADSGNWRVRSVAPDGIIRTYAGGGSPSDGIGDGGPATSAALLPDGLSLAKDGSLYIVDQLNSRVRKVAANGTISTVAGGGSPADGLGDGLQATDAALAEPAFVSMGADGRLLISCFDRIRSVSTSGIISTLTGGGSPDLIGDGLPATFAALSYAQDVAVSADGSLYIADAHGSESEDNDGRIRMVSPDGIISTIAGGGSPADGLGDGGPATKAAIAPQALALGSDGSLYLADSNTDGNTFAITDRVRKVAPDGIITTVAGGGSPADGLGDGLSATRAALSEVSDVVVGPDGSLYIAVEDPDGAGRVRQVAPDGIIRTIAGGGTDDQIDGISALQALLPGILSLALDGQGDLYIGTTDTVYKVTPDGIIRQFAGGGADNADHGDGGLATAAYLDECDGLAVSPDGSDVYISDNGDNCVRRVTPDGLIDTLADVQSPLGLAVDAAGCVYVTDQNDGEVLKLTPAAAGVGGSFASTVLPSPNGSQVYVFANGRQTKTLDALTGATLLSFAYDTSGRLTGITDAHGNLTTIERDAAGDPTAIVAPGGQRTTLTLDGNGYLAGITCPLGNRAAFAYTAAGLMTSYTDRNGGLHSFSYDAAGRLTKDADPAGGSTTLARTELSNGVKVTSTSAEGRTTTYEALRLPGGQSKDLVIRPDGSQSSEVTDADGSTLDTYPDGSTVASELAPDPRFGLAAPLLAKQTVTLPSGLTSVTTTTATAALSDPTDPLSLAALTTTETVNGASQTTAYDAAGKTLTVTSPAGRVLTLGLDAAGEVASMTAAGIKPLTYTRDAKGEVTQISCGTRTVTIAYAADGTIASITDPLGDTRSFTHNAAGLLTSETGPDGAVLDFTYDKGGDVTGFGHQGQAGYALTYTPDGQLASLTLPAAGAAAAAFAYDKDGDLTSVTDAAGKTTTQTWNAGGQLSGSAFPNGSLSFTYDAAGRLTTAAIKSGETVAWNYDGPLVTKVNWSGPVAGSLSRSYDANGRVTSESVDGAGPIAFGYDADGAPTKAGDLAVSYAAASGLPTSATLGALSDAYSFNDYAEAAGRTLSQGSTQLCAESCSRDAAGRITQAQTTIGGVTTTWGYTYDAEGRLSAATKDGAAYASYGYDDHGNRTSLTAGGSTETATYDAADRITGAGTTSFTSTADGQLASRSQGGKTTTYTYDGFGDLSGVTLPDGHSIGYLYDARHRRVGKTVDGTLTQGFLWDGDLQPVAWLDGSGALVARFVYAGGGNVPEYMLKGGVEYRFVTDATGSVHLVVNAQSGAVVQRLDYDPWGQVTLDTNPGFQPFGFAGGLYDPDTGLVRFALRDYDPAAGRWTTPDPAGFSGGDPDFYTYAGDDPVNQVDPSGKDGEDAVSVSDLQSDMQSGTFTSVMNTVVGVPCTAVAGAAESFLEWSAYQIMKQVKKFTKTVSTVQSCYDRRNQPASPDDLGCVQVLNDWADGRLEGPDAADAYDFTFKEASAVAATLADRSATINAASGSSPQSH